MTFWLKIGLVAAGAGLAGAAIGYYFGAKCDKQKNEAKTFFDVLFFPDSKVENFGDLSKQDRIGMYKDVLSGSLSLQKMKDYLSSAQKSIDVCLFAITSQELAAAVLDNIRRGVKVRLICDYDAEAITGSQVGRFREAGSFVRSKRSAYIMHHKFACIDGRILMTGSFNWTMTAAMGNRENVIVTNEPEVVQKFKVEFEHLWQEFAP